MVKAYPILYNKILQRNASLLFKSKFILNVHNKYCLNEYPSSTDPLLVILLETRKTY